MSENEKVIVKIKKEGSDYIAVDKYGELWTSELSLSQRKNAFESQRALERTVYEDGPVWLPVLLTKFKSVHVDTSNESIIKQIEKSIDLRPEKLIVSDLKWKFAVRTILRGENIMLTGPAGCGKTVMCLALPRALNRPFFNFNLGATSDPKSYLVGNSHLNTETGTYFSESDFVKAIQTKNAVILLDELSRAHPDAWNILMPILDPTQRYLRLDEQDGSPTINVAQGVTFLATANVGTEYTSTRQMDWAMVERFTNVEMDILTKQQEIKLLTLLFPTLNEDSIDHIADVAQITRNEVKTGTGEITSFISTRSTIRLAGLMYDGFKFLEAFEACIYSQYDDDGGAASERTYLKQILQQYEEVEVVPEDDEELNANTFGAYASLLS